MMKPTMNTSTSVSGKLRKGRARLNGAAPKTEPRITRLRPKRSPIGPPAIVPSAEPNMKMNRLY